MGLTERVARAIAPEAWASDLPVPTRADTIAFHQERQKSVACATAAIAAVFDHLQEPSEAMVEAGEVGDPLGCDVDRKDIPMVYGRIWEFMLSQARRDAIGDA